MQDVGAGTGPRPPPPYNTFNPPQLLTAGILCGEPIGLVPSSVTPLKSSPFTNIRKADCFPDRGRIPDSVLARWECSITVTGTGTGRANPAITVVKSTEGEHSRLPHNPRNESKLLARLCHPNIVPLLNAYLLPPAPPTQEIFLTFMPFYPYSLKNLLDAPAFCSQSVPWLKFSAPLHTARPDPDLFMTRMCYIALSMTFAVSYIHSKKIAHRDLNPHNWMLTAKGVVTLLDFGVAWGDSEEQSEKRGELHFDVGTSYYRAPELLYGSRNYDPFAADIWSIGTILSDFFTNFVYDEHGRLKREPFLAGGDDNTFAVISSIYRILGTPTESNWPEAKEMPNFRKICFDAFVPTGLLPRLPKLARRLHNSFTRVNFNPICETSVHLPHRLFDIIERSIRISARRRIIAPEALRIMWDISANLWDLEGTCPLLYDGSEVLRYVQMQETICESLFMGWCVSSLSREYSERPLRV